MHEFSRRSRKYVFGVTKVPDLPPLIRYAECMEVDMTLAVKQVREIALENPATSRVFEQYGIDYCCGGHRPLADACQDKGIAVSAVLEAIENLQPAEPAATE
ncbi:MAG: DUF542 domain-containing protein, partial [Terracidiphilus sp.]